MKTLILYAGKYGATADCAQRLCALLGDAQARDLAREPRPELAGYDAVILGASVYMGRPRKEMVAYAREAQPLLLQRRLACFSVAYRISARPYPSSLRRLIPARCASMPARRRRWAAGWNTASWAGWTDG